MPIIIKNFFMLIYTQFQRYTFQTCGSPLVSRGSITEVSLYVSRYTATPIVLCNFYVRKCTTCTLTWAFKGALRA